MIDATCHSLNLRPPATESITFHSATKYLGGHNDLLAGVLVASTEKLEEPARVPRCHGRDKLAAQLHLLQRGLKTFELRMQRHNENGQAVSEFLANHPRVEQVYYPGLACHPYHDLARTTITRIRRPDYVPRQRRRLATNGRRR